MTIEKIFVSQWVDSHRPRAARAMSAAISATDLVHERPGFGWQVRPAPGSVLASVHSGHWDPEPDYFYHWLRDAAIVMRAAPLAMAADPVDGPVIWVNRIRDYIEFSLEITDPKRIGPRINPLRTTTQDDHEKFLRPDEELSALSGSAWLEEPRFAADGDPDLERWSRPQDDGPALRVQSSLALIEALPELSDATMSQLIERDLAQVIGTAGRAAIGPWEEAPPRRNSFTLIAQFDSLRRGAVWAKELPKLAADCVRASELVEQLIQECTDPNGAIRESIEAPAGAYDCGTVMALLDADNWEGPFALDGQATQATLSELEAIFAEIYPINTGRSVPVMGRWREDVFFGGNPWYPCTLGCAELDYRIAARRRDSKRFARAEERMSGMAEIAPSGIDLPEQFDRVTGEGRSCPALTWSAAAFLQAAAARDEAIQALALR